MTHTDKLNAYSQFVDNGLIVHVVDSAFGIYIPQRFATLYPEAITDPEQLDVLERGPEAEWYHETWEDVLNDAYVKGFRFYQDQGVHAVHDTVPSWALEMLLG